MSERKTIVVGVTGGIAAYKSVSLVRLLVLQGHDVHVVPTEAALRFVGLPTFEAISRNPVTTSLYDDVANVRHVALGQRADLIVIAPATAHFLAALTAGLADDLLGTTVLASRAPLIVAPAMHTEMWTNPATAANVSTLRERGIRIVGPADGQLTGSDSGLGRMVEPEEIVAVINRVLAGQGTTQNRNRDFSGRRVVISAGGTREPLDPVRFIGNRSSGKQGVAIARAALDRGADVVMVCANLEIAPPSDASVVRVQTAEELRVEMSRQAHDADVIIMSAAVSDFRPLERAQTKLKKADLGSELTLSLVANPDILTELTASRRHGQTVVGFAAETESDRAALHELGRGKVARKKVDYLVVNEVGWDRVFATERNDILMLDSSGDIVLEASGDKLQVANRILDTLV